MKLGLPETHRLFDGYSSVDLEKPEYRPFVVLRLLEEGDRAELRALVAQLGESELAAHVLGTTFDASGAGPAPLTGLSRQLSARSRVFWIWLLGGTPTAPEEESQLWPLA